MAEIRIGELAKRTGVSKETIHFYLREGLIPRPRKTSRNMAYYDEDHVRYIQTIKRLQNEKFLPLSVIKRFLKGGASAGGRAPDRLLHDAELVAELLVMTGEEALRRVKARDLKRRAGTPAALVDAAREQGLIRPEGDERGEVFRHEDVEILRLVHALETEAGFGRESALKLASTYERHAEGLVRDEVRLILARFLEGEPPEHAIEALRRGRGLLGRLLTTVRSRALQREIELHFEQMESAITGSERLVTGALGDAALAATRFANLEEELSARAVTGRTGAAARRALAELYAGIGRFHRAAEVAEKALGRRADGALLRIAGGARFELGEVEPAIVHLTAASRLLPDDALVLAYLGSAYLRRARDSARTLGTAALADAGAGIAALTQSRKAGHAGRSESLRTALVRGRVYGVLPDFFGMFREGLAELRWVLDETRSGNPADAPLRESGELHWLAANAHLLLAQLCEGRGRREEASTHAEQAVEADPDGQLGRRAAKVIARLGAGGAAPRRKSRGKRGVRG